MPHQSRDEQHEDHNCLDVALSTDHTSSGMKILITGAAGFIGRNLVSRLSLKHEVFAVIRRQRGMPFDAGVSAITMDLAHELDLMVLPEKMDAIIHTAHSYGLFPQAANESFSVSVSCTQRLLDYGVRSGARQFVLASTGDVYGRRCDPCAETDPPQPESFYGATKYSAELLVHAYSAYLVPTVLRIFHTYGPGQTERLVAYLAKQILSDFPIRVHNGCRPYLTPTYIDDVCLAFERALDTDYSGILNVAGDVVINVKGLAGIIAGLLGREAIFEETGEEVGNLVGVNHRFKEAFNMNSLVELEDGLSRTFVHKKGN